VTTKIHRDNTTPLLLCNAYAHSDNPLARDAMIQDVVKHLNMTGACWTAMGDWNCIADEGAMAHAVANACARLQDEFFDEAAPPTRTGGRRRLDYAISSGGIRASTRMQAARVQDHHMVAYRLTNVCEAGVTTLQQPTFTRLGDTSAR